MAKHVCEEDGDTERNWHFQGRQWSIKPQRVIHLPSISCPTSSWSLSHYTHVSAAHLDTNGCSRTASSVDLHVEKHHSVSVYWHGSGETSLNLLTAAFKSELLKRSCMHQLFLCLVVFLVSLKTENWKFDKTLFILKDQHWFVSLWLVHIWINKALMFTQLDSFITI